MSNLMGRTALVTGASRGIGRGIAERLAADGAEVGVHYGSNEDAAKAVVESIEKNGGKAVAIGARLGVDGDVDTLFGAVEGWLAGRKLNVLVNNAGVGAAVPIEHVTPEQFDEAFAVNVRATFFITQRALPLIAEDGGRIVNVASVAPRMAAPQPVYAMTKGAVGVLTLQLANWVGKRGITVNAVAPGVIRTDMTIQSIEQYPEFADAVVGMTALGRLGEVRDVSDVVAFLASEDSRWITGQVIDVSGGTWLGPIVG